MDVAILVAVIGGLFSIFAILVTNLLTRRYEKRSTNIAVLAEVQRLLSVVESHMTWWQKCVAAKDTEYPLVTFTTPVFDKQVEYVGRIEGTTVALIVRFYGYLKFINALQAERTKYVGAGKGLEFDQQYLRVLEQLLVEFKPAFNVPFVAHELPSVARSETSAMPPAR